MSQGDTPPAGLVEVDELEILILADNLTDITLPDRGPARRPPLGELPDQPSPINDSGRVTDPLVAEHGFGALVTARAGDTRRTLLFDAGGSPRGLVENARRLQIDLGTVEAIVLSHNHFDHTAGLAGLVAVLGRHGVPAFVHPHFWRQRRITLPGQSATVLHSPSRAGMRDAGFSLTEDDRPQLLFAGAGLLTGEVPRRTSFELGMPQQEAYLDGRWQPDPNTADEQALAFLVKGHGLVVLVGCSHPGLINIVRA
ncbi:MAG: MBL fold metallo-hydrolase, partial [Dermatophilaceae bacterium]